MKKVVFFCLVVWWPLLAFTEENGSPFTQPEQDQAAAADAWQKATTPNENHTLLGIFVGDWAYNLRSWNEPGAKPQESTGSTQNRWAMGERYLIQQARGSEANNPFEGLGITGFDNIRGQYVSTWIDNTISGLMTAVATYDPKTSTFKESGTAPGEAPGQKSKPFRAEWKVIDADHSRYTMFSPTKEGKEFKSLEVNYSRR